MYYASRIHVKRKHSCQQRTYMGPKIYANFVRFCCGGLHTEAVENVQPKEEPSVDVKSQPQQDDLPDEAPPKETTPSPVYEGTNLSVSAPSYSSALQSKLKVPFKDLTFHALIGKGSFKQVYRGKWNNTNVAIVAMRRGGLVTEARLMQQLGAHPNLVQFYRWSNDHRGNEYIVVELVPFGSLNKVLTQFGPSLRNRSKLMMCEQICHAMCELASEGVLHRDLAARNILVQSMQPVHVKVSDFGLARVSPHQGPADMCNGGELGDGSCRLTDSGRLELIKQQKAEEGGASLVPVRWSAPEVLRTGSCWSEKSDVYSYGVTMWEIFSDGAEPYANRSDMEAALAIVSGDLLPRPKDCPHPVYALMKGCWQKDPAQRPSFRQIAGVFRRWRETKLAAKAAGRGGGAARAVAGFGGQPRAASSDASVGVVDTLGGGDAAEAKQGPCSFDSATYTLPPDLLGPCSQHAACPAKGATAGTSATADVRTGGGVRGAGYVTLTSLCYGPDTPMLVSLDGGTAAPVCSPSLLPAIPSGEVLQMNGQHYPLQSHKATTVNWDRGGPPFGHVARPAPPQPQPQQPRSVLVSRNVLGKPEARPTDDNTSSVAPFGRCGGASPSQGPHSSGQGASLSSHLHQLHGDGSLQSPEVAASTGRPPSDDLDLARTVAETGKDTAAKRMHHASSTRVTVVPKGEISEAFGPGSVPSESAPKINLLRASPSETSPIENPGDSRRGGLPLRQNAITVTAVPSEDVKRMHPPYVHLAALAREAVGPVDISGGARLNPDGVTQDYRSNMRTTSGDVSAFQLPQLELSHLEEGRGRWSDNKGPPRRRNTAGAGLGRPSPLRPNQNALGLVTELGRDGNLLLRRAVTALPGSGGVSVKAQHPAAVAAGGPTTAVVDASQARRPVTSVQYDGERLLRIVTDTAVESAGVSEANNRRRGQQYLGAAAAAVAAAAAMNFRHVRHSASTGAEDQNRSVRHVFRLGGVSSSGGGTGVASVPAGLGGGGGDGSGPCACCSSSNAMVAYYWGSMGGSAGGGGGGYGLCETCILSMEVETAIEPLLSVSTALSSITNRGAGIIRDGSAGVGASTSFLRGQVLSPTAAATALQSPSVGGPATMALAAFWGHRRLSGLSRRPGSDTSDRALESGLDSLQASVAPALRETAGDWSNGGLAPIAPIPQRTSSGLPIRSQLESTTSTAEDSSPSRDPEARALRPPSAEPASTALHATDIGAAAASLLQRTNKPSAAAISHAHGHTAHSPYISIRIS